MKGRPFQRIPTLVGKFDDMEMWERAEVLARMHKFGINSTRGWKYTFATMTQDQKVSAFDDVCERFDLCRECGKGGHFVQECEERAPAEWADGLSLRSSTHHRDSSARLAESERRNAEAIRVLMGQ